MSSNSNHLNHEAEIIEAILSEISYSGCVAKDQPNCSFPTIKTSKRFDQDANACLHPCVRGIQAQPVSPTRMRASQQWHMTSIRGSSFRGLRRSLLGTTAGIKSAYLNLCTNIIKGRVWIRDSLGTWCFRRLSGKLKRSTPFRWF